MLGKIEYPKLYSFCIGISFEILMTLINLDKDLEMPVL